MIKLNKIYNEDCLEGMKRIPDGSVDMILCDLPYGTTANKWDSVIPFDELWEQYERVISEEGNIVLTASQPFTSDVVNSNRKLFRYEWIWQKEMGTGFLLANKQPLRNHENVLVFGKKSINYFPVMRTGFQSYKTKRGKNSENYRKSNSVVTESDGDRFPLSIIKFNRDKDKMHPTQKPVALFEYLIKTYTEKGDTVLDNCMGSGTTAIACLNTERNFIGFETNIDYYKKSLNRIENNETQLELF